MLTQLLQGFTLLGEEWVLWILIVLSVCSVAIFIERLVFFLMNRLSGVAELTYRLTKGDEAFARQAVEGRRGIEAAVVREALNASDRGPEAVQEIIEGTIARERLRYDAWLSFLGTLGNNAPFIGLFGTVLGIIRAFHDLANASVGAQGGASVVMSGISGALVATAVGLAVAIPAVVAFNLFQRWLKRLTTSATALGHAWQSHLKAKAIVVPAVAPETTAMDSKG
jgi:biopolymer transport protein ExbB